MMATTVPHGMATNLVEKLCGIDVSIKAMEDMTERRGAKVLQQDAAESHQHEPYDAKGLPLLPPIAADSDAPKSKKRVAARRGVTVSSVAR